MPRGTRCSRSLDVEQVDEPVSCDLIEDQLVAKAVRPGASLGPRCPFDQLLEPCGGGLLIGVRLGRWPTAVRVAGDLSFERADRPVGVGRPAGQRATAVMVGLGEKGLAVALGEDPGVDQLDRLVGEVKKADCVGEVAAAATEATRECACGDLEAIEQ